MEYIVLQQLTPLDGEEGFRLLQRIGEKGNDFTNPMHGKSFAAYKNWLIKQDKWSRKEGLPDGYLGQTCFWLVADGVIVGIRKLRRGLTKQSRLEGDNMGYAIAPNQRGKALATKYISLFLSKAQEKIIGEMLLIKVKNFNYPSKVLFEKNGCKVIREMDG